MIPFLMSPSPLHLSFISFGRTELAKGGATFCGLQQEPELRAGETNESHCKVHLTGSRSIMSQSQILTSQFWFCSS